MFIALVKGFVISLSLFVAIGPQNAYLIRKGLLRSQVLLVTTTCFLSHALMVSLGSMGMGSLLKEGTLEAALVSFGGGLFLTWCGAMSLKEALHPTILSLSNTKTPKAQDWPFSKDRWAAILPILAFTYLNPHVYIDSLVVLAGVAATYESLERLYFMAGAVTALGFWFYGIGYGAAFFSSKFKDQKILRLFDFLAAIVIWLTAVYLFKESIGWYLTT